MNVSIHAKKGFLYGVITYYDEANVKRHKWISTGLKERGNKKEAKKIAEEKAEEFEKELIASRNKISRRANVSEADKSDAVMLFTDYCDRYVEERKPKLSASVYYGYKRYIPLFKKFFDKRKLRLIDVTEKELNEFYDSERKRGVKEISLKHYNCVLRPALRKAYQAKLIPDNPFDFLEPIHKEKSPMSYYDKGEMKKLFELIKGHPLEVPLTLAAYYGFRRSEVLGIRWSAVDFEHKLITINHKLLVVERQVILTDELKTKTSHRTLPLIPPVEELLLRHKAKIEENKAFYGNVYDKRYLDYVCVEEDGKIVYPDHLTKKFADLVKENGLRHIRLHDLRHSCASNMLASGVPLKEIQEWLGHSDFSTTANVYSHLDFSFKIKAANTILSAYSDEQPIVKKESELSLLEKASQEMKALGFTSIEEYLAYKAK